MSRKIDIKKKQTVFSPSQHHSWRSKIDWMLENEYGGVLVWALDLDDFNGSFCGRGPFPLTQAMRLKVRGHDRTKDCSIAGAVEIILQIYRFTQRARS